MKGESESPVHGPLPDENYLKSTFGSVSYCVVILRTTPRWSVRMTSCNFRLSTWEQQIKKTFAACVRTNNKFQLNSYHGARGLTLLLHPLLRRAIKIPPLNFCGAIRIPAEERQQLTFCQHLL